MFKDNGAHQTLNSYIKIRTWTFRGGWGRLGNRFNSTRWQKRILLWVKLAGVLDMWAEKEHLLNIKAEVGWLRENKVSLLMECDSLRKAIIRWVFPRHSWCLKQSNWSWIFLNKTIRLWVNLEKTVFDGWILIYGHFISHSACTLKMHWQFSSSSPSLPQALFPISKCII